MQEHRDDNTPESDDSIVGLKQSITRLVDGLVAKGYITRRVDEALHHEEEDP